MNRTTKPKGIGIAATVLLAALLIVAATVPASVHINSRKRVR